MTINMRVEINSLFLDLAQLRQGEHLESAGIGKDRSVPVHKLVKSPKLFHDFVSGAHMKMIRVGQLYLRTDLMKIYRGHSSLNCSNCSYIHENRSLNRSMNSLEFSSFRSSFCCNQFIFCHFISLLKISLADISDPHCCFFILSLTVRFTGLCPDTSLLRQYFARAFGQYHNTFFSFLLLIVKLLHCHFLNDIV